MAPIQALLARFAGGSVLGGTDDPGSRSDAVCRLFLLSTFVAAAVVGLAGFAFGLVASGIWLYILSPVQTATMILAFGFLVQSYAVWVQRGALDWPRIWPMVLGSAFGIPVGIAILTAANPAHLRIGVGPCWCSTALRPGPSGDEAAHRRRRAGRRRRGLHQRPHRRHHGARRRVRHDLVPIARRPARPPARGVPAGRRRELRDVRRSGSVAAAKSRPTPIGWSRSAFPR